MYFQRRVLACGLFALLLFFGLAARAVARVMILDNPISAPLLRLCFLDGSRR